MDQDRVIGSPVEIKAAAKETPSLALALFPQPQLLVASDLWRVSDGDIDRMKREVQNDIGRLENTPGEK